MGDNTNRVKPILFSGEMVRALLDGRKTQTRRVIKPQPELSTNGFFHIFNAHGGTLGVPESDLPSVALDYVPYTVGGLLYVRETWRCNSWATDLATIFYRASEGDGYTAMCEQYPVAGKKRLRDEPKWHPSIHMPRWTSRITLEVTDVRVQRLQGISDMDAISEGCRPFFDKTNIEHIECPNGKTMEMQPLKNPSDAFHKLWDSLNEKRGFGWDKNPWVVAVTFKVHKINVDDLLKAGRAKDNA